MFSRFSRLRSAIRPEIWLFSKSVFFGLSTAIAINDHIVETVRVEGVSMCPTLSPTYKETGAKDTILMNKWNPLKDLKRGDVVMLDLPHKPEKLGIKRVVALEGDWVTLDYRRRDKRGKEGPSAEGMVWEGIGEKKEFGVGKRRWKVPYGHVWVEGDNVNESKDSNSYGPISKSLIVGKAIVCLRPFDKFGEKPWEGYNIKTKVEKDPNFKREGWEDLF